MTTKTTNSNDPTVSKPGLNGHNKMEEAMKRFNTFLAALCVAACTFGCNNSPTGDASDNSFNAPVLSPETCDTLDTAETCQGIIDAWNPDWCPGGASIPTVTLDMKFTAAAKDGDAHLVGTVYSLPLAVNIAGDGWVFTDPGTLPFGDYTFEVKNVALHYSVSPSEGPFTIKDEVVDGGAPNAIEFEMDVDDGYLAQLQADCESGEVIDTLKNCSLEASAVEYGSEAPVAASWRIGGNSFESDDNPPEGVDANSLWVEKIKADTYMIDAITDSLGSSYGEFTLVADVINEIVLVLMQPVPDGSLCTLSTSYAFGSNILMWYFQQEIGRGEGGSCVPLEDPATASIALGDCSPTLSLLGTSTVPVEGIYPHLTVSADPDLLMEATDPYSPCTLTASEGSDTLDIPIALVPGEVEMSAFATSTGSDGATYFMQLPSLFMSDEQILDYMEKGVPSVALSQVRIYAIEM